MITANQMADQIIVYLNDEKIPLSTLKLQKLLYYVQAWSLAVRGEPVFKGKFQAWVHGPVCREVYERFKEHHMLYDVIVPDIGMYESVKKINEDILEHTKEVLSAYGKFTGIELENMTHNELPWVKAREGYNSAQRCEIEIDENLMQSFYAKLLEETE